MGATNGLQVKDVAKFKSKYILRGFKGDWWITGNHVVIDDHYFEYRKRNWHLISVDSNQFHWQYVESITVDKHLFGATIRIYSGGLGHYIYGMSKKTADQIKQLAIEYIMKNTQRGTTEALADAIASAVKGVQQNNGTQQNGGQQNSMADEILKLKQLRDQGTITDEEFEDAKEKLLYD